MAENSIDHILQALDDIVDDSVRRQSHLGIFAYIYRRTTAQIKAEIEAGNFEDNARMRDFDILFAKFYLDAYHDYTTGNPISESWKVAFDAGKESITIIQHLLLGMNAHINFDLAVAAGRFMEGKQITELQHDFNKVNEILANLLNEMQLRISKVSFLMFLLDWLGKRTDEKIINFSMARARGQSWRIANELWALHGPDKELRLKEVDRSIAKLGIYIKSPKSKILKIILMIIKWFEVKNIQRIVQTMKE